jgi:hypothetical protein
MIISAVVICRDRVQYVARCLSALMTQTAKAGEDFEIVLVEQGRASRRLAGGLPATYVELPYGDHVDVPWLSNVGARIAKGQYIYNVECDMILEPSAIRKVLSAIRENTDPRTTGCFGGWRRSLSREETTALQRDRSLMPDETWGQAWSSDMPVLFAAEYYAWLGGYDERFSREYGSRTWT